MITKGTVSKIICDNTQSRNGAHSVQQDGAIPHFSESQKSLCQFIAALPTDELLDLLALMEYGRVLKQQGTAPSYCEIRKHWHEANSNLDDKQKAEKALYLLGMSDLSAYLQAALPILDLAAFQF